MEDWIYGYMVPYFHPTATERESTESPDKIGQKYCSRFTYFKFLSSALDQYIEGGTHYTLESEYSDLSLSRKSNQYQVVNRVQYLP